MTDDEVAARSADDPYPWTDAAVWSPGDEYGDLDEGCGYGEPGELACNPWEVPGRVIVLSARLGDGRGARWSMLSGWSGDECVVHAAQAVAELYAEMGEMCAAARGLIGVAVDGWVNEACWAAARLSMGNTPLLLIRSHHPGCAVGMSRYAQCCA